MADMEDIIKAAALGLIQGLTEFFPVSSSAHLKVVRELLDVNFDGLAFDVAVHLATLLVVLVYFRGEIIRVLKSPQRYRTIALVAIASVPLLGFGYLFKDEREGLSLWVPVVCWTISGSYLLLLRGCAGKINYEDVPRRRALALGVAQALAFFPGMSRSGSTIAAGIVLGIEREQAAKFSFLLSIPAILAPGGYQCLKIIQSGTVPEGLGVALGVAMPVAFVVGMVAIHLLLRMIRGNAFYHFGWYNLAAAIAFGTYLVVR